MSDQSRELAARSEAAVSASSLPWLGDVADGRVGALAGPDGGGPAPELTVVVPTFNEVANVSIVVERLRAVLSGLN
jgi:hypothetical protein